MTTADGTRLFYTDWGTGRPVVLIHGWPLSSAFWEYQATVVAEAGYRVVAYDRRGFGRSGRSSVVQNARLDEPHIARYRPRV